MHRLRCFRMTRLGLLVCLPFMSATGTRAQDKPAGVQHAIKAAAAQPGFRPQPLVMKTVYEVRERYPDASGGADLVQCDLSIEITNTMPIPIRLAFPPQGVFSGPQAPFAKDNDTDVPEFARARQIVEIGPLQTVAYKTNGLFTGAPGRSEWVFGKPADGKLPANLFIGSIFSDPVAKRKSIRESSDASPAR